ncbi:MAG: glycerate kinase [Ruminococcaceae bacterium]|nr:glycerate kinase [Oscillospiraceae bacterium]
MNVLIAIDSFKGSLTSLQAGNAVKDAVLKLDKNANVLVRPLADGGEGTVDALAEQSGSETIRLTVTGPLHHPTIAKYCILKETKTAVIEMASAAGITLVPSSERNPLEATTYGVGELIKDAIIRGCRQFIIGLGGSATNDGGTGMLRALGYEFLDQNHNPIALGAKGLKDLHQIRTDSVLPELSACHFKVACDVANPLCGENGCSAVYGPQKGATAEMIKDMDLWLERYSDITKAISLRSHKDHPGAGAAGGMGFAFLSFTNSVLKSGIEIVLDEINLEKDIQAADIVVTGEGRLDSQTVMGKAPIGVAKLAKRYGKKVIAFSGCVTDRAEVCNEHGIDAFFPILRSVTTLEEALKIDNAYKNLTATAYQVFRLLI